MRVPSRGPGTEALLVGSVPRFESLAAWNARASLQHVTSARVGRGTLKEERKKGLEGFTGVVIITSTLGVIDSPSLNFSTCRMGRVMFFGIY